MSAPLRGWSTRLHGWLAPARSPRPPRPRGDLVGRDFAHVRTARPGLSRGLPALVAAVLLAGLALAALRVDLIRVRYGLGQAMQQEKTLLEQERALRAQLGALRDPVHLARLAPRFGLARPLRVLDLPPAAPAERRP